MTGRLENRVALVFGAGSSGTGWGNGKAAAVLYAREGACVVAVDLDAKAAEETAEIIVSEGNRALALTADVTRSTEIASVVAEVTRRFERIDILHNNVGITEMGDPTEATEESWDRVMAVNLKSVFLACKHVLPVMKAQNKGAIVNISSLAAVSINAYPYFSYYASKSGLNHLTRALAVRYAPFGIRANAVMPGLMDTPLIYRQIAGQYADAAEMVSARNAMSPMGFMGDAFDVARAALFLASDDARYITGVCLPVDGGLSAGDSGMQASEGIRPQTDEAPPPGGEARGARGARSALARAEAAIGKTVEALAGSLVAVETLILFAGVVSRYVFLKPLTWSDELASILFLWLAMLGAVVAYRRGEHMRMGALIANLTPRRRAVFEALALCVGLVFLACVIAPAIEHAVDEADVVTPALELPSIWRAAALPAGIALMLLFGLMRLVREARPADLAVALGTIALVGAVLLLANPLLAAIGNYKLVVFFVLLTGGAVLAGIPIAFAFGIGTFAFLALTTRTPMTVLIGRLDEGMSHIILLAVPLFVFLGLLIEITGLARHMVGFLARLIGNLRGGLHYVLVAAMYLVSGISGAKAADMAAVAPVLFPEMKARGARGGELVALLAATGAQTETIPPSLVLITIGSVTGVSIAAMFVGGLLPGAVLAVMLACVVWWRRRHDPPNPAGRSGIAEIARAFIVALPGLILPFVIRAAVVRGIATATEVSTIGVVYAFLYALLAAWIFREKIAWARLWPALVETAALSGAILFIIGTATGMAWALTQSGFSRSLAEVMTGLPGGAMTFMAASILAFMVLGSVLEGIPAIVLFGPLLFPIARAVGIHEVHYAMVVILAMGIGLFAPPFGVGYYTACAIGRVDPAEGLRAIWPYMVSLVCGLVLVALFPWISIGFLR